jgi:hypothetical protein
MTGKLEPATPSEWQAYYKRARDRRREMGYQPRGPKKKHRLDPGRVLAVVMGLATVVVILCLVIPT